MKFSEDVVRLSDLQINPGKVISRVQESRRPMLLTNRSCGMTVVQGLEDYEKTAEELRFVKAVAQGLMDARQGDIVSAFEYLRAATEAVTIRVWRSERQMELPDQ